MRKTGYRNETISKLEIVGAGYREMECPYCGSYDRERLIMLFLDKSGLLKQSNISILHIAPEPRLKKALKKLNNINYLSGDKYEEAYIHAYDSDTKQLDVMNLPFHENSFDIVMCNHVLEHVENDELALEQIKNVLKVGGTAILQVPISYKLDQTYEESSINTPEKRTKAYGQFDHLRLYGKDYPQKLKKIGFEVHEYNPIEYFGEETVRKAKLNPNEILYTVKKKKLT